ncbi:hypothetical protein JA33_198 [Dickeya phage vB_DsoM_JA33]|uniref:Uncharacterized protein n=2 Tax=Salmondvirus JA11 TaxID=2734141 RepID=A0A386K721_9CAUD|nr:hypothetical protein HOU32_gp198 [Dickeya phage vB_DsoM_JA11]AXG67572.1 hypothetical protein JA33_198 [Dickeya phage vB_DsoM_JA33]AYD80003.1 hypothetical protein JA11_198 [Dickeya phage vB_DsoM_JA11]
MSSNERLAALQQERYALMNKTFWDIFNAFEKSFVILNDPFFPNADWLYYQRTISIRVGKGTGHSTFAKELAAKYNAFLLTMDHEAVDGEFCFTHNRLRELYHKVFESGDKPTLFVIDDAYQFGGRIESLQHRLIKFRDVLGEAYIQQLRFVLLN